MFKRFQFRNSQSCFIALRLYLEFCPMCTKAHAHVYTVLESLLLGTAVTDRASEVSSRTLELRSYLPVKN